MTQPFSSDRPMPIPAEAATLFNPRTMLRLVAALGAVVVACSAVTFALVYRLNLRAESAHLMGMTNRTVLLLDAAALSNSETTALLAALGGVPDESVRGAVVVGRSEGSHVVIFEHSAASGTAERIVLSGNGDTAAPMQRALAGHSGTMVGRDYRGRRVLAAYAPATRAHLGVVTKMSLSELREPLELAALLTAVVALLLVGAGAFLFRRFHLPVIRRLMAHDRQVNAALRASRAATWAWDIGTDTLTWGASADIVLGRDQRSLPATMTSMIGAIAEEDRDRVAEMVREAVRTGARVDGECRVLLPDISPLSLAFRGEGHRDPAGTTRLMTGACWDVTGHREAEREARRMTRLYKMLSQINKAIVAADSRDVVFAEACRITTDVGHFRGAWVGLVDAGGNIDITAWNAADEAYVAGLVVTARDEPRGRGPSGTAVREVRTVVANDVRHAPSMAPWREAALRAGHLAVAAVPITHRGAAIGVFTVYAHEVGFFDPAEVALLEETAADISFAIARLEAEADAHRNNQRLALAIQSAQQGLWDLDLRTGDAVTSREYATMLGFDPATFHETNAAWLARLHPDEAATVERAFRDYVAGRTPQYQVEFRQRTAGGEWKWILSAGRIVENDADGRPRRMVGTHTDITERKLAEEERWQLTEQLRHAQRIEALGQLSGGIAHDFNNLLTVIMSNAEILSQAVADLSPDATVLVSEIESASHRGAAMVRKLLAFSRRERLDPKPLALADTVGTLTGTMRRLIPETVQIRLTVPENVPLVLADAGAVEQVLLNLATNARDAMPDGGVLTLVVHTATIGLNDAPLHGAPGAGTYVCVDVTDTGGGMSAEVQERMFEPFFTTKPVDKGTGLGMPMVLGLMQQHNGFVSVYSEVGRGTRVRLAFPAAPGEALATVSGQLLPPRPGTETVLVVEDEPALRRAARRILEKLGYTVLVAGDGVEALSVLDQNPGVSLVLSDMVMPNMSGVELWRETRRRGTPPKFLFATGYAPADVLDMGGLSDTMQILAKPWTALQLGHAVREALDAPAPTASG